MTVRLRFFMKSVRLPVGIGVAHFVAGAALTFTAAGGLMILAISYQLDHHCCKNSEHNGTDCNIGCVLFQEFKHLLSHSFLNGIQ